MASLVTVHEGDCLEVLAGMADASIDAVVTDPPYALPGGFMGRSWDMFKPSEFQAWCEKWARECLRVLKPGGFLLAFGGTRTYHRLACGIEDAGFEVRDSLHWIYGSGFLPFPKSLDVSKAIDKAAGAEREVVGYRSPFPPDHPRPNKDLARMAEARARGSAGSTAFPGVGNGADLTAAGVEVTAPATDDAARWSGFGTALKPAHEPIVVARKPLAEGTVAANVLAHGTGALNINGCRVGSDTSRGERYNGKPPGGSHGDGLTGGPRTEPWAVPQGRWPPNILLTHSADCEMTGTRSVRTGTAVQRNGGGRGIFTGIANRLPPGERMPDAGYADANGLETVEAWDCAPGCPVAELDRQSGVTTSAGGKGAASQRTALGGDVYGQFSHATLGRNAGGLGDTGGASRFFPAFRYEAKAPASERPRLPDGTAWPTVKPVALMRWLVRLVTPPGGTIFDPFAGTGTTAEAAILEGFRCVLAEKDPVAVALIRQRLARPLQPSLPEFT